MLQLIFGLMSIITSIAISISIEMYTKFQLHHFVIILIPLGAFLLGLIAGIIYYRGLIKLKVNITIKHYIIGFFIGLMIIGGIHYTEYKLTSVNEITNELYLTFNQDNHISNYEIDGYGEMNFLNYEKYNFDNTQYKAINKNMRTRKAYMSTINKPFLKVLFLLYNYIILIFGVIYVGVFHKDDKEYCQSCKNYMEKVYLFLINLEDGESFIYNLDTLIKNYSITITKDFSDLVYKYNDDNIKVADSQYKVFIHYCHECNKYYIKIERYVCYSNKLLLKLERRIHGYNNSKRDRRFNYKKKVSYDMVKEILRNELGKVN